jgi:tetratricopeptide (TPR) repeat protein
LLGLVWRDQGKVLKAADAFERAALLRPIQPLSRLCLAECYAVLKRHTLARDLYLIQAEQGAEDVDLLLLVASGLDGIDQPQMAMELCRKAAYLDPECGQVAFDMCFYAMRCGRASSLVESLAWRAVELEPENVHFRIGLASVLVRLNQLERAIWVLRYLENEHFRQVTCRCCLERIMELYRAAGDNARVQNCMRRLGELTAEHKGESDSFELSQ